MFGLLGPNGAGKSTAVKILTTLRARRGPRAVAGIDVVARAGPGRASIGVVAQGSGVDVQATGRENLRLQGQVLRACAARELERRVAELLERFGLADAADRIAARLLGRDAAAARHRDGAGP